MFEKTLKKKTPPCLPHPRWAPAQNLSGVPPTWNSLGGNSATASAFNPRNGYLYFTAGSADPKSGDTAWELAAVSVDLGAVVTHVPLSGDLAKCGADCLMALTATIF